MQIENENFMTDVTPCTQIVLTITRIYQSGMTTTSGGNISVKDSQGNVWITPSGVDKGSLSPKDITCIKNNGTIIGKHKVSLEYPVHRAIYRHRPDVKAIIHAHPPSLVSFSIVHELPDANIIPQAKFVCGAIGYASYALPGSDELAKKIAEVFAKGHSSVIMENHGVVVGGTDLNDAYQRLETLEFCAKTIINAKKIGRVKSLTDKQIEAFEAQIPEILPEMDKVDHPPEECYCRDGIANIVQRACKQGLMISSYGTISVRWHKNDFLITPTNVLRWDITSDDVVQIRDGKREPKKLPSRTTWLHQEIYRSNPKINSIIFTQSPYVMAFGITGKKFDTRIIPESWIFLQDVVHVPYGSHFQSGEVILKLISKKSPPVIIIENDSVLITGDKLIQTFDRLEVAESSAKSLIGSTSLGLVKPIGEHEINDLRKKFLS